MFRVSNFAKIAASAKNALTSRTPGTALENLTTINASVEKLTQIVVAYTGGLLAASPISSQEAAVGIEIKNATNDAKVSEAESVEEAKAVIAYIAETLEPTIRACMAAMKDKKDFFVKASLIGTVTGDLKDMQSQTETLSNALLAKSPKEQQQEGERAVQTINADFEDALKFFS